MSPNGIFVVGCSAGGVEAMLELLPGLERSFPLPIAVVMHLGPDSGTVLPDLLVSRCTLKVKEAEDKELISAGSIYFAPAGYHLLLESDFSFSLSVEEPVLFSRPSIDVFFKSVAASVGPKAVAVLLTGANSDGAEGLCDIVAAGGAALVQDPSTAAYSSMPGAALRLLEEARLFPGPRVQVAKLNELGSAISSRAREFREGEWKK